MARIDFESVQLRNLEGLVEVRQIDETIKIFWSLSSHKLMAIDIEAMTVIRYGQKCDSQDKAIQKALIM